MPISGIQRLIFGDVGADGVRDWLDRHVRARLDAGIDSIAFTAGDIGAVFGLRLHNGRTVVLKALRPGASLVRVQNVVACQNRLAAAGFPAPAVLDGPSLTDGVVAVIEEYVPRSPTGNPHEPQIRATMAAALANQIDLLRDVDGSALNSGRPAWANWETGAWPAEHDPIFDFSRPVPGYEWLDETANGAAAELRTYDELPPVVGHSDWVWQNVCVRGTEFVAGYDWDSLIFAPECMIVGLVAGSFTQGSSVPPHDPTGEEIAAFIADYPVDFGTGERKCALAAATWVRCYNARCHLDNRERRGMTPPPGSALDQLGAVRH
jgi:phosphotransferase family enzyme